MHLVSVAFAGVAEEDQRLLRQSPFSFESLSQLMRPEFRMSQSYFISHAYSDVFADKIVVVSKTIGDYEVGGWHPEDAFLVPLYSPHEQKLLGCLFLDDPEDGKIPSMESVETVELFANLAALAIDNTLLFQEREAERVALEQALSVLHGDLVLLQQGDLRVHVRSLHEKLQPVAYAINAMVEEISAILRGMQTVTLTIDEHLHNVQRNSKSLVRVTLQQGQQANQVSQVVTEITRVMQSISERAATMDKAAVEAGDVTHEAQASVDRAVEGMGMVREATMQSARTMKLLGESGQEIDETITALNDLKMRMHLLALNAAIEATRAGEHGQGFTVVAQEMRTLAAYSAEISQQVNNYIRTIQHETSSVSQSVEQSTQQVVVQTELVTQTSIALDAISVVTERLKQLIQNICSAAESQSQTSPLIIGATNEILHIIDDVARYTREVQLSTTHLVTLTNSLRSRMAEIQLRER